MRGEVGKETPKKEMELDLFYDVTHDTFKRFKKTVDQFFEKLITN